MTPTAAYRRLNALLWLNRLPNPKIVLVENETMPRCYGLTIHDEKVCVRPVILLNASHKKWGKTLVHEMVHIAEPQLRHSPLFTVLVDGYWRIARARVKGLK